MLLKTIFSVCVLVRMNKLYLIKYIYWRVSWACIKTVFKNYLFIFLVVKNILCCPEEWTTKSENFAQFFTCKPSTVEASKEGDCLHFNNRKPGSNRMHVFHFTHIFPANSLHFFPNYTFSFSKILTPLFKKDYR